MLEEREPAPVLFLLGAGASADAGCPTVVGMVDGFRRYVGKQASGQLTVLDAILDVLSQPTNTSARKNIIDIERLLAAIRALERKNDNLLFPFVHQWKAIVGKCEVSLPILDRLLQHYIRQECTIDPTKMDYMLSIADFVGLYGQIDVFTLNYDAGIEIACQQREIPYTDGFDLYWNPAQFSSTDYQLRLFKLHGSLLWYTTKGTPRRLVKIPVKATGTDEIRFFTDDEVSDTLIYPTLAKEQHVEPYATLTGEFRKALAHAKALVAIGCSFRDEYVKQIVLERMLFNPDLQLIVVDPKGADAINTSDELLAPEWRFQSVKSRISLVLSSARKVLASHQLLDHVRDVQNIGELRRICQKSVLSGEPLGIRIDNACSHILSLLRTCHACAFAQIVTESRGPSVYVHALRRELVTKGYDHPDSPDLFPPVLLVAALSRDSSLRREAKEWLEGHIKWLLEFAVRKEGSTYRTVLAGQKIPQVPSVDEFFILHSERVLSSVNSLKEWADRIRFGLPKRTVTATRELLSYLELVHTYFERSVGKGYGVFSNLDRTVEFPRGADDDLMVKLAERCDEKGFPLAVSKLLQRAPSLRTPRVRS
jgi:hypothetical protein